MKREHRHLFPPALYGGGSISSSSGDGDASMTTAAAAAFGKGTASWAEDDELLAVLGYKVRSSDMAKVAQKLEQLEEVMGNVQVQDDLSDLASKTVHYNPSDMSGWLESMLAVAEFDTPQHFSPFVAGADDPYVTLAAASVNRPDSSSDYDLRAIPGRAILNNNAGPRTPQIEEDSSSTSSISPRKRLKTEITTAARPVVLVDSQENGIRLVHALTACAEALQQQNHDLAEVLVKQIGFLAASQAGAMGKVAAYFAEALTLRVYRLLPDPSSSPSLSHKFPMHLYENSPYLKFAHFTANQAILQAFSGRDRVHVVDLAINQGHQWPALMQSLLLRPGGAPAFRLTGIGPPSPDAADRLRDVGYRLAHFAERIHVRFEYRSFVTGSLADLDPSKLGLVPGEAVAVNSVCELHRALALPAGIGRVLSAVRAMGPEIVAVVEQESSHNGPVFLDRFMEALRYYSTVFDSLDGAGGVEDRLMSEMYLGRQICNVVACEGADRVERHEPLAVWRNRFEAAGFTPVHLGSDAFRQASMLLRHFAGGNGFRVEEDGGCLLLGWHTRALLATSAWRLGDGSRLQLS